VVDAGVGRVKELIATSWMEVRQGSGDHHRYAPAPQLCSLILKYEKSFQAM
jgi:hypothetical protein